MVLPRRWSRCRLLARYQRCRGGPRDHGGSTVGQGKPYGSRVYRDRAAFASSVALGQSRTPAMTQDATWLVVPVFALGRRLDAAACSARCFIFAACGRRRGRRPPLPNTKHRNLIRANASRNQRMPVFNMPFILSVVGAFLASATVAYLYVWPAVRALPRFDALRLLAAFHAFRFFGMNFLVTGFVSPELNSGFASKVGWGDLIAAVLALFSMAGLSRRWSIAIPVVWTFNIWGTLDLLNAYYMGATQLRDPGLMRARIYVPALYVPMLVVSHLLIFLLLLNGTSVEQARQRLQNFALR